MKASIGKWGILLLAVCGAVGLAMGGKTTKAATWKMKDAKVYTSKKKTMKIKKISKWEKKQLKWSSSDKKIATVNAKGKVKGIRAGEVEITARLKGSDKEVTATVTVLPYVPVDTVTITNKPELYLVEKEKCKLGTIVMPLNSSYREIEWTSSNPKVATVSQTGKIKALKKGKTKITAKVKNTKRKSSFKLRVKEKVKLESLAIEAPKTTCIVGEKFALEAVKTPEDSTDYAVNWSTSSKKIATIDEHGVLTAHKEGTVTVKARSKKQKKKAQISIVVNKIPVTDLSFNANNPMTMEAGTQRNLQVQLAPTNATYKTVKWTSSDRSMATVDANGRVTALRPTEGVDITATSTDSGISKTWTLKVTADNGTVTKAMLDKLQLTDVENVMIVTHPDDESLWGGAHLLHEKYLVVCMTNAYHQTRHANFDSVMQKVSQKSLILNYPDVKKYYKGGKYDADLYTTSEVGMRKDIRTILSYKKWKKVVTHNPFGEYGKFHHQRVSAYVSSEFDKLKLQNVEFYYFGKFYDADQTIPGEPIPAEDLARKNEMIQMYLPTAQGAIKAFGHMIPYENWIKKEDWTDDKKKK